MSNSQLTRAIGLYNWPESFSFSENRSVLADLTENAGINPSSMGFYFEKDGRKNLRVSKNHGFRKRLDEAPPFTGFDFCRPIGSNFLTTETEMTMSEAWHGKEYKVSGFADLFTVSDSLRHVTLVCRHFTPRYGVSLVARSSAAALFFLGGGQVSGATIEHNHRASVLGTWTHLKHYEPQFDRLVDVFELNVLNDAHLRRQVFGQTLASWIGSGKSGSHGQLIEINSRLAVWLVPNEIRSRISLMFFHAKLTEVATTPLTGRGSYFDTWVAP